MACKLDESQFEARESKKIVDPDVLIALIRGEIPAYIIRGMSSDHHCEAVYRNFSANHTTKRTDHVPGIHVGAFHYGKTTREYIDAVGATTFETDALLTGANNIVSDIHDRFRSALLQKGIAYRAAVWAGQVAGQFVARSWAGNGEFALSPHEDLAQLQHPGQYDFEIQAAAKSTVVGVNLCIHPGKTGGALRVWNLKPDDSDRTRLGVQYTGYPYPLEFADREPSIRVRPQIGDTYCVNGNLLHAVEQHTGGSARVVLSFVCGFVDSTTVVYWT